MNRKKLNKKQLREEKCPMCGKLFYPLGDWAYSISSRGKAGDKCRRFVCSWSCMRKHEKEHPPSFKWKGHEQ